jgi:hypothetical protein
MYALGVVFLACLAGIGPGGLTPGQVDSPADLAGPAEAGTLAADHASSGDQAMDMVPASLAALWAACLGPNPAERPSAAHAAVMSRQTLPAPKARATAPKARAADWTVKGEWGGGRGGGEERASERRGKLGSEGGWGGGRGAGGAGKQSAKKQTRRRLVTVGGVATVGLAAAAVAGVLLATSPGPRPASPASSTTAAAATSHPAVAGASPAGSGLPTPESTAPVLATSTPTTKRIPLSPLAAIKQLRRTIAADVASGQVRQDVGVDFGNLIQPVETGLAAGQPAPVAQLAATLREKLWTRVSEGAVTVSAATVLNDEITALAHSAPTT